MNLKKLNTILTASVIALSSLFMTSCESDTDSDKSIISGIKIGMTEEEVFDIVGSDYYLKEPNYLNPDATGYYYSLDSVEKFDIDMSASMFFEFSSKDVLYNFGYHIGETVDAENESSYPYSEEELVSAYDKIYDNLTEWYGEGTETNTADPYAIKEYTWHDTGYGDVWFIVGMDMWDDNSGNNEILISSCDDSLRDQYPY